MKNCPFQQSTIILQHVKNHLLFLQYDTWCVFNIMYYVNAAHFLFAFFHPSLQCKCAEIAPHQSCHAAASGTVWTLGFSPSSLLPPLLAPQPRHTGNEGWIHNKSMSYSDSWGGPSASPGLQAEAPPN